MPKNHINEKRRGSIIPNDGIKFAYNSRKIGTRPISHMDDAGNLFISLMKVGKTVPLNLRKVSFLTQTLERRQAALWR
jgi:hypothetical protein